MVQFLNGLRNLNKQLKRKTYPMPKSNKMLLKLDGFQYAMSLDLNMVYYHIRITEYASNLCTIINPFGKYNCKRPPMGLDNSPAIPNQKINNLFQEF